MCTCTAGYTTVDTEHIPSRTLGHILASPTRLDASHIPDSISKPQLSSLIRLAQLQVSIRLQTSWDGTADLSAGFNSGVLIVLYRTIPPVGSAINRQAADILDSASSESLHQ